VRQYRITGIARFGDVKSIGNATAAIFTLGTAQRLFKKQGQVDSILVDGKSGTDPDELTKAVAPALPRSAEVKTAEEQDRFDIGGLKDFLKILQGGLVAFGGIALFVGAFIIFQHDVHHRRPAGARVRADPHGGRQPASDPAVGDPRGLRHRPHRLGGRAARRRGPRRRAERRLQVARADCPTAGRWFKDADGGRGLRRRDRSSRSWRSLSRRAGRPAWRR
jgi:hypothetical protein